MKNAIACHLRNKGGKIKSILVYLQTQLDTLYEKIQTCSQHSTSNKIVPMIDWQQKPTSDKPSAVKPSAQLVEFKPRKK